MRLTIVNQYYVPDISPTAHLAASLAEHRAVRGDQVTVIASRGGYADLGWTHTKPTRSVNPRVRYVWTPRLGKRRKLFRIADYASFYVGAALRMIAMRQQDVVVSLTTPPFIACVAVLHKLVHRRSKLILWNMDCYPEIAERTGLIRHDSRFSKAMRTVNRWLFARLDHLVILDRAMQQLLLSQYSPHGRQPPATKIPNWERLSMFSGGDNPPSSEFKQPGPDSPFTVLYLGNTGYGHSFDTVLEAAQALRSEPVSFVFVGGGVRWPELQATVRRNQLTNVILRGYVPKEETPPLMRSAHCAVITLHDFALGVMSPSKLHSNLAMQLPVIYVGPKGSNVDEAVTTYGCGISVRNGQSAEIVAWIRKVMESPSELGALRKRARYAFEQAYCDEKTLPKFDLVIDSLLRRT